VSEIEIGHVVARAGHPANSANCSTWVWTMRTLCFFRSIIRLKAEGIGGVLALVDFR
jgi:hypothetical protein